MKPSRLHIVPALFALATPLLTPLAAGALESIPPHPDRAETLAATCANCHGTHGQALGAMPSLAGRPASELVQLLAEFRDGQRPATIMPQIVRGYRADELRLIADHFARQEP